jgi:hypothetical protein
MRILNWDEIRQEQRVWAAFNLALLKAIDPRLVTHRPRDPEKKRLMAELGIEMSVPDVEDKCADKEGKACKIDP